MPKKALAGLRGWWGWGWWWWYCLLLEFHYQTILPPRHLSPQASELKKSEMETVGYVQNIVVSSIYYIL